MDTENTMARNKEISCILRRFTDDYSSADVEFISSLSFPKLVKITDLEAPEQSPDREFVREVDDINELNELMKRLPEKCEISIPDISNKMRLVSRL